MKKEDWIWMPHPGHLIVSRDCRFHLNTCVGDFIVSTVGEYLPDSGVREIIAQTRGITLRDRGDERLANFMQQLGWQEIGAGRLYETYVFRAKPSGEDNDCCPFRQADGREIDGTGYNDSGEAFRGHMETCEKWSKITEAEWFREQAQLQK